MERQKHWWNGRFANLSRRDIYLWADHDAWLVEARRGSLRPASRLFACSDESSALTLVGALVGTHKEGWREVPA